MPTTKHASPSSAPSASAPHVSVSSGFWDTKQPVADAAAQATAAPPPVEQVRQSVAAAHPLSRLKLAAAAALLIGVTSAITLGHHDVAGVMAFYGAYLVVWAVLGARQGYGVAYGAGLAAAGALALWHYTLIRDRFREGCFKAFRLNHWVGFAVFAGVVADHALRTAQAG